MKLDDERQELNTKGAVKKAQEMESEILESVVDEIEGVLSEKTSKAQALKNIRDKTKKIVDKNIDGIIEESNKALEENSSQTVKGLSKGIIPNVSLTAQQKEVKNYFKKYITTKGTNFVVGKNQKIPQFFTTFIEREIQQVVQGTIPINVAIKKAIKELSQTGLKVIDYDSGVVRTIDVFVRQQILYAQKQHTQDIRNEFAKKNDITIFEFDAYPNARPSHQKWQGKRYDTTGRFYPTLNELTHGEHNDYGCKHRAFPVWDKDDKYMFTEEQLKKINTKPFEWKGKEYNGYSATQKQRQYEREIRALKRERNLLESRGEKADDVKYRLSVKNKEYKQFCEKMGTYRRNDRTSVAN